MKLILTFIIIGILIIAFCLFHKGSKKLILNDLIVYGIAILYIISLAIAAFNVQNSDIGTIINPIIFYVLANIMINNIQQNDGTKRLSDINNIALIGYGISYLSIKHINNSDFISKMPKTNIHYYEINLLNYKQSYITLLELKLLLLSMMLLIILITILILIIILYISVKHLSNQSHWIIDQNNIKVNTTNNANLDNKFKLIYSKNKTIYNAKGNIKKEVTKNKYKKED